MDSRLIYTSTAKLETLVAWDKEWTYFGNRDEVRLDLVESIINSHFDEEGIFLKRGRRDSLELSKSNAIHFIKSDLGEADFSLWAKSLKKVIKFSKIGVLLKGSINL